MHVVIVTDRYAPEARAAAYLSSELAKGLADLGHFVTVITRLPTQFVPEGRGKSVTSREEQGSVVVKRIRGISGSSRIAIRLLDQLCVTVRMIATLLSERRADALVVYSPPLLLGLVAVLLKKLRRWPYVLNLHDLYPRTAVDLGVLKNRFAIGCAKVLEAALYRNAERIVVAAPASKRILVEENGIDMGRVEMVFNYIDIDACAPGPIENEFRQKYGLQGRFVVLYAGLMGLAQDLGPIMEAARVLEADPRWVFVLAGDGPCAAKWAEKSRSLKNVRMLGPLCYSEYYRALQAADVCVVALSKTFRAPAVPGKVPTIMAAGRPILAIVPEGNDTREIVSVAGCGVAVAPNPTEVLSALRAMEENAPLRQRWGANGAAYASVHFDSKRAIRKLEKIVVETVQPKARLGTVACTDRATER